MSHTYINGRLFETNDAAVSAHDHGLVTGDGVFETLAVYDGTPFAVRRHLQRLARSVAGIRLAPPDLDEIERAIFEVVAKDEISFGKVRVTYTAGNGPLGSDRDKDASPLLVVAASPLAPLSRTARVSIAPWPRNERGVLSGLKTTSYAENVVALDWALSQGSNEVIFANTKGDLCEGSGSNIFLVVDGQLITPTLESGCLAGVTRDLIIEYLGAKEMDVPISTLVSSRTSEAFLASTLRDAQSITHVDETPLHNAIGPVSLRIAKELKELIMDNLNP